MKEEITDVISPEGIKNIKVGQVLIFKDGERTTHIKVTRKTRKRIWGKHIELIEPEDAFSHLGHDIDTSEETVKIIGVPWCEDCDKPVREHASEEA